ncbi:MAG: N-acetylmuramoyl-L-alanine amidase [Nitrospiraceae bacterium]|nr:N-acetylmuramoyl-L-alanine amidase [Nitrospiraceae bacterium]
MSAKKLLILLVVLCGLIAPDSFKTTGNFFSVPVANASPITFLTKMKVGLHRDHIRIVLVLDGPVKKESVASQNGQGVISLEGVMPSPSLKKNYRLKNRYSKKLIREITVVYKPGHRTTVLVVMESSSLGVPHTFNLSSPSRVVIDYPVGKNSAKTNQTTPPARRHSRKTAPEKKNSSSSGTQSSQSPAVQSHPGNNGKVYVIPGKKLKEKKKETGTSLTPPPVAVESGYELPVKEHRMRIVLDAGHGGKDCGTTSVNGYCEKDLVLDIVRRLGILLSQDGRFHVFYTRTDDSFISLKDRTRIANRDHGDLFLSIHANADPDPSVRGIQTYLLTLHSKDKRAMALAKRENASLGAAGDLGAILLTLRINHKKKHSMELASSLDNALIGTLSSHYSGIRDFGVKHAPFYVIMGTSMPAVLTEVNFLSNRKDAALMAQGRYRQRVAEGLYKGIVDYDRWVHPEKINRLARASIHQTD